MCPDCQDTGGRVGYGGWCDCAIGRAKRQERYKASEKVTAWGIRLFREGYHQTSRRYGGIAKGQWPNRTDEQHGVPEPVLKVLRALRMFEGQQQLQMRQFMRQLQLEEADRTFNCRCPVGRNVWYRYKGEWRIGLVETPAVKGQVVLDGHLIDLQRVQDLACSGFEFLSPAP